MRLWNTTILQIGGYFAVYLLFRIWFALMANARERLKYSRARYVMMIAQIATWALATFCTLAAFPLLLAAFLVSESFTSTAMSGSLWLSHHDQTATLAATVFIFSMLGALVARRLTD